ncbi:MAG TPA: type II secretion system F family protein, partial [Candidatus Acidoferrum sp.]|nr:type II secretion system F family protein [Candidatus Acidoferrum sp.]
MPEIEDMLRTTLVVILRIAAIVFPLALLFGTYCLLSLPLRRRERAREFLDLLDLGIEHGGGPEQAIIRASETRDKTLSMRFHMLASHLRAGASLAEALRRVPRLLPPQVTAMLLVGIETGDLQRVLPLCRHTLDDAVSQTRGALNYLAVLTFVILPIVPVLSVVLSIFVLPKFEMIAADLQSDLPSLSVSVFGGRYAIVGVQVAVMLFFQLLMFCYVVGPRMHHWIGGRFIDRLLWQLPWRRKRIQRDFSSMLALMLDAGVPDQRAVQLAGDAAANHVIIARARTATDEIARGVKLTDALRGIDGSDELHWRLKNAV